MTSQAPAGTSFDIGRILQRGFKTLGRQALVFSLLALLLVGFPNFILQAYGPGQAASQPLAVILSPMYWVSVLLMFSGNILLQAAVVRGTIRDLRGEPVAFGDLLVVAFKILLPMIGLTIVGWIICVIGLILLIAPGVIALVMLIVAVPALVEERRGVFGSIGRSRELTKGYRWWIFLLLLLFLVAYGIFGALLAGIVVPLSSSGSPIAATLWQSFLGAIIGLLGSVMVASLYFELRTLKDGTSEATLADIFG